ncbi:MAG: M56 family metallopeptidase [Chloroflexi bacterium]|nr:M56 family metallopeptidase [Chloroflexota bacterium]
MRTEYIFGAVIGLFSLVFGCLSMLAGYCPGCGPHWLQALVLVVIAGGAVAGLLALGYSLWRTQCLWHQCRFKAVPHPPLLQQVCQRLGMPLEQVICADQPALFSFCIGLLRPRIVVSTGLLDLVSNQELMAILAHEHHHQRHWDPLRLLVVMLARVMLYPLPAIHDLHRSFQALIEIEADETAVAHSGRPALAAALCKLFAPADSRLPMNLPTTVASFSAQTSRLDHLLDPHRVPALPLSAKRLALSLAPFFLLCITTLFT